MTPRSLLDQVASILLTISLAACGGGGDSSPPPTYSVGGAITGLASGEAVTLANGTDTTTITGTGSALGFAFTNKVPAQGSYAVSVSKQPAHQTCSVGGFTGEASGVNADVSNVVVTCSNDAYNVGGTINGLANGEVVTLANGSDTKTITGTGVPVTFTFTNKVAYLGSYAVSVSTQPTHQTCSVSGLTGSGAGVNADVNAVTLTCSGNSYNIGGTITGLASGEVVTLANGSDTKTISGTGAPVTFTLNNKVAYLGSYSVAVSTQPLHQTCSVSGSTGTGSGVNADVSSVTLACSSNSYTIGGTITGLASGEVVTLANGSDSKTITGTGSPVTFTFANKVAYLGSYAVSVSTQPTHQVCSVSGLTGTGSGVNANVSTVTLACSSNSYSIGGTITGLASGEVLTLANGSDTKTITGTGAPLTFTFTNKVAYLGSYAVSVSTQPTHQVCSVSGLTGTGSGVNANVSTVTLACSSNSYSMGGTITGLASGEVVTLANGSDSKTITGTGSPVTFTFTNKVAYLGSYSVSVSTPPTHQTCSVSGSTGTGSGVSADVTTVALTCSNNSYNIGGTITGLASGEVVTLANGADAKTITGTGSAVAFTFTNKVAFGGGYSVSVSTQPTHQTCGVSGSTGTGSGVNADVTTVALACSNSSYSIGGTVTGLLLNQAVTLVDNGGTGGNVATITGGGTGSDTFTFATKIPFQGSYSVAVSNSGQPSNQTCRVSNGSGSNVAADVATVGMSCRLAIAYVVNATDHTVSQYTIGIDGTLTALGSPIDTQGVNPNVVAVDPSGRFAYVTNFGSNTVAQFVIAQATGALSFNGLAATGSTPYSVVVDPTGRYAYVTNQDDPSGTNSSVSQFTIGPDGKLTGNGSFALPSGSKPYQVTVDPTGQHAYVANRGTSTVSQFNIDGTGALVPMTTAQVAAGTGSLFIAINPAGTYAYVSNFDASPSPTVSQFSFDGTGALVASSPTTTVSTGNGPYTVAISPNGLYAYWSNKYASNISQCSFASLGALNCSAGVIASGTQPQFIAIDPFGRYLYAVDFNAGGAGAVSQYTIGVAGVLSANSVPTASTGNGPFSITTTK